MRYKNNIGPQVRRRRYALGWSQSDLATKLQLAGFDTREERRLRPAPYVCYSPILSKIKLILL